MKTIIVSLGIFFIPIFTLATVIFTEIMYDPEGNDTNKEYIEIKNTGNNPVNLENYKFCDSESCRKLKDGYGNDFNLASQSFGILTKDPNSIEFKNAYSNFNGFILQTNFTGGSLRNSLGELLELKDSAENILDSLTYNPASGGKNGRTLSIFNNVWKEGEATPGRENLESSSLPEENEEQENEKNSSESNQKNNKQNRSYSEITDMIAGQKKLQAEIDKIETVVSGAKIKITGRAFGLSGAEIKGVDFLWSLGDGTKNKGKIIYHEYYFPGEYLVSLIVKSAGFTSPTAFRKITVIDPPLEISQVDFEKKFIEIKNNSNEILNLQDWILMVDGDKFIIPDNTYILENGYIKFTQRNTLLQIKKDDRIFLLYPNHKKFREYKKETSLEILIEEENNALLNLHPESLIRAENTSIKIDEIRNEKSNNIENDKIGTKQEIALQFPASTSTKQNLSNNNFQKKIKVQDARPSVLPVKTEQTESPVFSFGNNQSASILALKKKPESFLRNNLVEISFVLFIILVIFLTLFYKKITINLTKEEADKFEIKEKA